MPRRFATLLATAALAAALLGGCGGSSPSSSNGGEPGASSTAPAGASAKACVLNAGGAEGLSATGISCGEAQRVAVGWRRGAGCEPAAGASRSSCSVRSYRCLATSTARGFTVGCSRPGRSLAFTVRRR